jgi:hypothetical protein
MEVNETRRTQRDSNWGAQPADTGEAFLKCKSIELVHPEGFELGRTARRHWRSLLEV